MLSSICRIGRKNVVFSVISSFSHCSVLSSYCSIWNPCPPFLGCSCRLQCVISDEAHWDVMASCWSSRFTHSRDHL